ncbi:MAG: sigma-70 family RNA polymerase sigma factor [Sphingobacteriaceae bacterium]|nr:MAG: sigma-70 family RNA polymerase sigma factor [Sphingobacteriaceae bacterium]
MPSTQPTDQQLWQAIVKDDHAAFTVLFDRYWSKVYTTAYNYLRDRDASTQIAHDIFLNIWLKRDHLEINCFEAYLRTASRYHVYKYVKAQKSIPIDYVEEYNDYGTNRTYNTGETNIRYLELESRLDDHLKILPKRCRDIFILSRRQQLSNDQIAGMLGISKRTVENQLTHALHHIRASFKDMSAIIILLLTLFKG